MHDARAVCRTRFGKAARNAARPRTVAFVTIVSEARLVCSLLTTGSRERPGRHLQRDRGRRRVSPVRFQPLNCPSIRSGHRGNPVRSGPGTRRVLNDLGKAFSERGKRGRCRGSIRSFQRRACRHLRRGFPEKREDPLGTRSRGHPGRLAIPAATRRCSSFARTGSEGNSSVSRAKPLRASTTSIRAASRPGRGPRALRSRQ